MVAEAVSEAAPRGECWLEKVRVGLVALLGFLDDQPHCARLLLKGVPARDEVTCRRRVQAVLGVLLDTVREGDDRREQQVAGGLAGSRELRRELVLGGVFSVIERMLDSSGGALVELAPSLMAFIMTSYRGHDLKRGELLDSSVAGEPTRSSPLRTTERPIRATYRTSCVLRAICSLPRSSNREIADAAGLSDEGQTSKLLSRLERRGLIENVGLGAAYGEPNEWLLTPEGQSVVKAIGHGFAASAAVGRGRRVRGTA